MNSTSREKPSLAPEAAQSGGMAVPGMRPMETRSSHWVAWMRERRAMLETVLLKAHAYNIDVVRSWKITISSIVERIVMDRNGRMLE